MSHCIFCENELTTNTSPEHILLDAFGGRKKVRTVDCTSCNSQFGKDIDLALANQTLHIRNLLRLPNGSSGQAPTLKRVKAGNRIVDLGGDGTIKVIAKPFSVTPTADGQFTVSFNVNSITEIEKHLPDVAAITGIPIERLREQLGPAEITLTEQRPDIDPYSLSFGGEKAIRAAAKACLVLWTTLVGNEEVRTERYQEVRTYILNGGSDFTTARTDLDYRKPPIPPEFIETYSPIYNLIYVASDALGKVIGHYTLNNILAFQIVLAEAGGTPNRCIALISNPVTPSVWSDKLGEELKLPFDWLANPDGDHFELARERLGELMRFYFDKSLPEEISRIVDDVMTGFNIEGDQAEITHDMLQEIVPVLADRTAKHAVGLPHQQKMTYDQAVEAAKRKPKGSSKPE